MNAHLKTSLCKILFKCSAALFFLTTLSNDGLLGQDDSQQSEIREQTDKLISSLNQGSVDEVVSMFLSSGELIDENGTLYQGQQEIANLVAAFFEKFPGSKSSYEIESIRIVGPIAMQDGRRITIASDGSKSSVKFSAVLSRTEQGWRIASLRDFADPAAATPGENLKPLSWLIGEWINEGADARVSISYRWSEDQNFILGEVAVVKDNQVTLKSSQRIAWDATQGRPRSWTFDSDGGFAEATWTQVDDSWVVRSSATLPDAQTGSATLKLTPKENGSFVISGTNRIVGNASEEDLQITVVKQPPTAGK